MICGRHRCVRDCAVARGYLFAVASPLHRNSEGGRGQAEAPAILCRADEAISLAPKAAGGLVQTSGNVEGHHGVICWGSHPHPQS